MSNIQKMENVKGLKQPIRITADGRDIFFEKTEENKHDDLYQEVRDALKEE